jgi:AraC family transcriptional regulator
MDMDDRKLVVQMIAYIEQNLVKPLDAGKMALRSGYSLNRLRQKFFNIMGDTPSGYLRKRRLTEAAKEILAGRKILDVCLKYGYSSQDNFTTAFRSYFGVPPKGLYTIDSKYKRFISKLREEFSIMEIVNLKQPPLNTTLMGCIKGAADYFDLDLSAPMLYGLSGHAFLINIHKELCPSSPYVWDHKTFYSLLSRLGITLIDSNSFNKETPEAERQAADDKLKRHLDDGNLCMLTFLEHQLFSGYDENGYLFLQPWDCQAGVEIPSLTFNTWDQCLDKEGWVMFDLLKKTKPEGDLSENIRRALQFALELYKSPEVYEEEGYRIGHGAYTNWIEFIKKNGGNNHGHWWNGMVWSECREFAAAFFQEFKEMEEGKKYAALCDSLSETYSQIGSKLGTAKEKELDDKKKISLLTESAELERKAETGLTELASLL